MERRYYYKSQDGKGLLNLKTPLTTDALEQEGYIEITADEFAELQPKPYEPTDEDKARWEKQHRIAELKSLLASYDYKTSKRLDGEYTDEEWAEIVSQRKAWREEINKLEDK